jgi:hypothetical protein
VEPVIVAVSGLNEFPVVGGITPNFEGGVHLVKGLSTIPNCLLSFFKFLRLAIQHKN